MKRRVTDVHAVGLMRGKPNQLTQFRFPHGTIDLSTLNLHVFIPSSPNFIVPSPAECLIQRLTVRVGGSDVNNIAHYSQLQRAYETWQSPIGNFARRAVESAGRAANPIVPAQGDHLVLNHFLGLLGSKKLFNSYQHGQLEVDILWETEQVVNAGLYGDPLPDLIAYFSVEVIADASPGLDTPIAYSDWTVHTRLHPSCGTRSDFLLQHGTGHRWQYSLATLKQPNWRATPPLNPATGQADLVPDLGFQSIFKQSRLNADKWKFWIEGEPTSDYDRPWWEYISSVAAALRGVNEVTLPLILSSNPAAWQPRLDNLAEEIFLIGTNACGRTVPYGQLQLSLTTTAGADADAGCEVFLFSKYSCNL